tara:strand:+ start:469 stop:1965 length:1497 start_codon:yes stop_codon:yes gene_type:complete
MAIRRGNTGSEVKEIQQLLGITVDGDFGPATQKAVIAFQQKYNLTADGIVGPITLSTLKSNPQTLSTLDYFIKTVDLINLQVNTAQIEGGQFLVVTDISDTNNTGFDVTVFTDNTRTNQQTTIAYQDAIRDGLTRQDVFERTYIILYPNLGPNETYPILTTNPSFGAVQLKEVIVTPQDQKDINAQTAAEKEKISNTGSSDGDQVNNATSEDAKPQGLQRLGKLIVKLYLKLKDLFLPQIEALILSYGISQLDKAIAEGLSNIDELKEKFCPTPERLEALILQRNNLAEVLNNTGSQLDTISAGVNFSGQFAELLQALVSGLKGAQFVLNQAAKFIALIPGAIVALITDLGTIADTSLTKNDGTPIIPKIKAIVTAVAPPFALIQQIILQCVALLDQLDELILLCAPNATLTPTSATIDGIVATQLIAENTNTGNTYKGFILEIETRAYTPKVDQSRAVGKNNQGIISITTDYSFASNPNVLIDELKFIIDRDNLKAY